MSAALPPWPALAGWDGAAPRLGGSLLWRRGIWGKVHGAASDYRWIARAAGCGDGLGDAELAAALRIGAEDTQVRGVLWRRLPDRVLAAAVYPSRARDSAGRLTVLEKQIGDWRPAGDTPAALAAVLLLPTLAGHDDGDWWQAAADPRWGQAEFALTLAPDHELMPADPAALLDQALAALNGATAPAALTACYAALLAGRFPALLHTDAPLPPAALAALLLPLPRVWAERLSIAGAVAARTLEGWDLRRNWDLIACPLAPLGDAHAAAAGEPAVAARATAMVAALRAHDPVRLLP